VTADRLRVGDELPAACDAHDLARAFGQSVSTIHRWAKGGKLRKFELRQPMGAKRWSGRKVQEFLDGGASPLSLARSA
jgi:hypothetical protein